MKKIIFIIVIILLLGNFALAKSDSWTDFDLKKYEYNSATLIKSVNTFDKDIWYIVEARFPKSLEETQDGAWECEIQIINSTKKIMWGFWCDNSGQYYRGGTIFYDSFYEKLVRELNIKTKNIHQKQERKVLYLERYKSPFIFDSVKKLEASSGSDWYWFDGQLNQTDLQIANAIDVNNFSFLVEPNQKRAWIFSHKNLRTGLPIYIAGKEYDLLFTELLEPVLKDK